MLIRGDLVRHSEIPEYGIGTASFMIDGKRSVLWKWGGHFGAGLYEPAVLIRLSSPESTQLQLPIGGKKNS